MTEKEINGKNRRLTEVLKKVHSVMAEERLQVNEALAVISEEIKLLAEPWIRERPEHKCHALELLFYTYASAVETVTRAAEEAEKPGTAAKPKDRKPS